MTTVRVEERIIPGADLGPENPLPPLGTLGEVQDIPAGPGVPAEIREHITYGRRPCPLPYTVQDGYGRGRQDKTLKTIVLENEHLTATFLPEYGGRMWALYDRDAGRDLIYENPVFQPANLAIRNAWLSGGVEWNIGYRGHSPFTCSPVFAARVNGFDGAPALRLYELERIRQLPFQIDLHLPPDSPILFVHIRIINFHDRVVPMYWWSNIAYPEDPRTRVVVPADQAFRFGYGHESLRLVAMPVIGGRDVTYPANAGHSADFFFDIAHDQRKWIAAIDREGTGLFQTSTDRQIGRKLFVWGTGPGGRAWQEFLSLPDRPYFEIQAGLAHTQMEHIPMPPRSEWSWTEAYGRVEADPELVHGDSWRESYTTVGDAVERTVPRCRLLDLHERAEGLAGEPVGEMLHSGSEWGALESAYRAHAGLEPFAGPELSFGCVTGREQRQWLDVLERKTFPCPAPLEEPVGYDIEESRRRVLQRYVDHHPDNWYAQLHLGLMEFGRGDLDAARRRWEESFDAAPNPWAYRNLARLAQINNDHDTAADLYGRAFELLGSACIPLTLEYGKTLLAAQRAAEWLHIHRKLPDATRKAGRFQLLHAQALIDVGDLDGALAVIESEPEVGDLREGENSLTDIWYRIHEKRLIASGDAPKGDLRTFVEERFPPPPGIDFRMRAERRRSQKQSGGDSSGGVA